MAPCGTIYPILYGNLEVAMVILIFRRLLKCSERSGRWQAMWMQPQTGLIGCVLTWDVLPTCEAEDPVEFIGGSPGEFSLIFSSRIFPCLFRVELSPVFFESNFPLSFSSRTFPCFFRVEFSLVFFEANFPPIFAAAASGQGLIKLIDRITHRQNLFRSLLAINFSRVYMTAQSGLSSFEHWQREIRALLSSSKHNGTPGNTSTYVFSQSLRARL